MALRQALRYRLRQRRVSVTSAWELVNVVTEELHKTMKRYRAVVRPSRMWHRVLYEVKGRDLSATIRADSYESGLPPIVSVDFYQPLEPRRPRVTWSINFGPPASATRPRIRKVTHSWEPTDPGTRRLTVRVGPKGEGRSRTSLNLSALKALPLAYRQWWLKGMRRARAKKPLKGDALWWIDPDETPLDVTRFVFLLYLIQAEMIDLNQESEAWKFVTVFARVKDSHQYELLLGLKRMARSFALPQHWKQLRKYLKRVRRTGAGEPSQKMEAIAAKGGIPVRTLYRWLNKIARKRGMPTAWLADDESAMATIQDRAEQRTRRRAANLALARTGKSKEAARKFLQRRIAAGETLEQIIKHLGN